MNSSIEKELNCKQDTLHDDVLHQIWMSLMIWSLESPCHLLKAMYSSTIVWIIFCIVNTYGGGDVRDDNFQCTNTSKEKELICEQIFFI